jgi:hypothetical protein
MKKIFSIMLLLSLCLTVTFAQRGENQQTTVDKSLGYDQTYFLYPGLVTDSVGVIDSTWSFTIGKLTRKPVKANFYLDLDSTGGTFDTVNFYIQKKVHDLADFVNTDTLYWKVGSDTIIKEWQTSSFHTADFWRLYIEGTNNTFKFHINRLDGKFVEQ